MNLQGFSTEQQQVPGLHRLADNLRQDQYRQEERTYRREQQEQQRKLQTGKFLSDLGDPKDFLSGSPLDPEFVRRLGTIVQKGQGMAAEGADYATLQMTLAKEVNELLQYSAKAKAITENGKRYGELLKNEKYINLPEFEKAYRQTAFYRPDGSLKDVSEIDPNQDYGDMVLRQNPDKIATSAGFDEFFNDQVKNNPVTESTSITRYTPSGGMSRDKVKIKRAGYFVADTEKVGKEDVVKGFVPKYEVATDENNPILNTFFDPEGKEVDAPVRLLHEDVYKQLTPRQLYYLDGQAIQLARQVEQNTGQKVDLNGPQGRMLKRALAYDELNAPTRKGWSIENDDVINKPSAPEIRNYFTGDAYATSGSRGSGAGEVGPTGNAFDNMSDTKFKNFDVKGGFFYNKDGSPKSGRVFISGQYIPASVISALKFSGFNPGALIGGVNAEVKDGVIQSVSNQFIGTVTREQMEKVYQPKMDTERKGASLNFGRGGKSPSAPSAAPKGETLADKMRKNK